MKSKRFRKLQKDLGLSNQLAAQEFNVHISTIKRWRNGTSDAPNFLLKHKGE